MLYVSLVFGVPGSELPHVGDVLTVRVTVAGCDPMTERIGLDTDCFIGNRHVPDGKAVMRLPRCPA